MDQGNRQVEVKKQTGNLIPPCMHCSPRLKFYSGKDEIDYSDHYDNGDTDQYPLRPDQIHMKYRQVQNNDIE